jgi:hypothetical protein
MHDAKANGWTRGPSGAVRSLVRESLVREGVRANLLAGVTLSEAVIVDAAAQRAGSRWRSHRRDIDALRKAVAGALHDHGGHIRLQRAEYWPAAGVP